jgi:hypothetical protein
MKAKRNTEDREAALAELGYMSAEKFGSRILGIAGKTMANRRDLPTKHKIGRENVYAISDVKAWIARRAVAR